jgi:hypothetical protein
MATEVLAKGRVSRNLPQADTDGVRDGEPVRVGRYDEQFVIPIIRKQHALVDEGSYFITTNASQTGILSSPATAWVATTPACIIYNQDSPNQPAPKRINLDYINLCTTVVGSAASALVNVQMAIYTDLGNRYTSGGTEITANIMSPSTDLPKNSLAKVYFGAITAAAATGNVKAVVPLRVVRPCVSTTVVDVVGETKWFNFGGVEGALNGSITIANANFITVPLPAIQIGPGYCALIYIWQNVGGTNVAATYAPEIAWWER